MAGENSSTSDSWVQAMTRPSPADKIAQQAQQIEAQAALIGQLRAQNAKLVKSVKSMEKIIAQTGSNTRLQTHPRQHTDLPVSGPDIERHRHRKG